MHALNLHLLLLLFFQYIISFSQNCKGVHLCEEASTKQPDHGLAPWRKRGYFV